MARLYLGNREFDFFSDITKEFMKDMVGHAIYYFPINSEKSDKNKLYGESLEKVFDNPIYLEAAIEFRGDDNFTQAEGAGLDKRTSIIAYLHKRDMDERNVLPKNGDFLQFGGINFEVKKVTNPKIIYGHINDFLHYVLECDQARKGNFNMPEVYPTLSPNVKAGSVDGYFTQLRGEQEGDKRDLRPKTGPPITGAKSSPFDGINNDDS